MEIFFCDVCSTRVSDSHLRRGHGVRAEDVIVCGGCIEQGHGKDLLERAKEQGRAIAAAPALAGAGVIDAAADRARTMGSEPAEVDTAAPAPDTELAPASASESAETFVAIKKDEQPNTGEAKDAHPVAPPPKARRPGTSSIRREGTGTGSHATVRPTSVFKAEPLDDDEDDDDLEDQTPGPAAEALFGDDPEPEEPSGVFDSLLDDASSAKFESAVDEPEPAQTDSEELFSPVDADDAASGDVSALDQPAIEEEIPTFGAGDGMSEGPSTDDLVAQLGGDDSADDALAEAGPSTQDLIAQLGGDPEPADEPNDEVQADIDEPDADAEVPSEPAPASEELVGEAVEPLEAEEVNEGILPDAIDDGSLPEPVESPVEIDPTTIPESGEFMGDEASDPEFTEFDRSSGEFEKQPSGEVDLGEVEDPTGVFQQLPDPKDELTEAPADLMLAESDDAELDLDESAAVDTLPGKFEAGDDDTKSNAVLEQVDAEMVDLSSKRQVTPDDADDDLIASEDIESEDLEEDLDDDDLPEIEGDEDSPDGTAIYTEADKEAVKRAATQADGDDDDKKSSSDDRRKTSSRVASKKGSRKSSTRKSTRGGAGAKKSGPPAWFIIGSLLIPLTCLGAYIWVKNRDPSAVERPTDMRTELEGRIGKAWDDVRAAMQVKTLAACEVAIESYHSAVDYVDNEFLPMAKRDNWSEGQMESELRKKKYYDLRGQMKAVRELKFQLEMQR